MVKTRIGVDDKISGIKFRNNVELVKQHFVPTTEKDDFIDHLLEIWQEVDKRDPHRDRRKHNSYRLHRMRKYFRDKSNNGEMFEPDTLFFSYLHFTRRNKNLLTMKLKDMEERPRLLNELLNQWNNQRKRELRDDIIEYILSERDFDSRKEILINARILYLRSLRVAAHYNPWLRERCDSILTQCEQEITEVLSDASNIGTFPASCLELSVQLQRLLLNQRYFHHRSSSKSENNDISIDKLIEKMQEKIDTNDEEEKIFGIVNKWWVIEMKHRKALHKMNTIEADRMQEQLEEHTKKTSAFSKKLSHYLNNLKSGDKTEKPSDEKSSSPWKKIMLHHEKQVEMIKIGDEQTQNIENCSDDVSGRSDRRKIEKERGIMIQSIGKRGEEVLLHEAILNPNTQHYDFGHLKLCNLYRKNGNTQISIELDYCNVECCGKDDMKRSTCKKTEEKPYGNSLIEFCRISISNANRLVDEIILANTYMAPKLSMYVIIDLMVRFRWFLDNNQFHSTKDRDGNDIVPHFLDLCNDCGNFVGWKNRERNPHLKNNRKDSFYLFNNAQTITDDLRKGIKHVLGKVSKYLKSGDCTNIYELLDDWKENFNSSKQSSFSKASDGNSLVIFDTNGEKKLEILPKPHLSAGEFDRGH